MNIRWSKLIVNLTIWTVGEITLNLVGLDTLADYSEFLTGQHQVILINYLDARA